MYHDNNISDDGFKHRAIELTNVITQNTRFFRKAVIAETANINRAMADLDRLLDIFKKAPAAWQDPTKAWPIFLSKYHDGPPIPEPLGTHPKPKAGDKFRVTDNRGDFAFIATVTEIVVDHQNRRKLAVFTEGETTKLFRGFLKPSSAYTIEREA